MGRLDDEIKLNLERAIANLQTAKELLENGQHDAAVSGAAESAFHTGSALLLDEEIESSQHRDVISPVQEIFVNGRLLTKEQGADLSWLFARRTAGDHQASTPISSEEARRAVEIAVVFLDAAKVILEG